MTESASYKPPFTLIIPAHNEAEGLPGVLRAALATAPEAEIIVVDDGSTDGSVEAAAREGGERVRVIQHGENLGYGAALKSGIAAARHDWVVIADGDGTYPIERAGELAARLREADMAVGARTGPDAAIPLPRRPAKWALSRLANHLTQRKIPDLNSGFRAMRREAIEPYLNILPDGFSFTSTITIAMLADRRRVDYVPMEYHARRGRSKIRPIRDTLNFLQLILRSSVYFEPLRVFVPISLALFAASLLTLIVALAGKWERIPDGTITVLFVAGVQLLGIGVVADLVNRRLRK